MIVVLVASFSTCSPSLLFFRLSLNDAPRTGLAYINSALGSPGLCSIASTTVAGYSVAGHILSLSPATIYVDVHGTVVLSPAPVYTDAHGT